VAAAAAMSKRRRQGVFIIMLLPHPSVNRFKAVRQPQRTRGSVGGKPMGRFFIVIIIISIAMVVGMAVLVTHF
jgi:hypothetical protein